MRKRLPSKFKIRDVRNGDWSWVYKCVVSDKHLTATDVRVYSALSGFDGKNHDIFPSYETISKIANVSKRGSIKSIKRLIEVGYVGLERKGGGDKSNKYILLKRPKGCKFCTGNIGVQKSANRGAKKDTGGVHSVHPNNKEYNNINNNIATETVAGKKISEIISLFEPLNPSIDRLYGNKTQRGAIQRLASKYGEDKLINLIKVLPKFTEDQYFPTITTPYQLEQKMGQLKAYFQKKKSNNSKVAIIQ